MNYLLIGISIPGIFLIAYYKDISTYLENISTYLEMEYLKMKSKQEAREITIEFFASLRYRNPNITLDEAILRFENCDEFDNLEDFATSKNRTSNSYREAYSGMFCESAILF
jgi:hypothetical protein